MTRLIARAAALAAAAFAILGPLAGLAVWSLAERWTAPSPWPQRFGLKYWNRMLTADLLEPLRLGVLIALIVTAVALLLAIPLGYALARLAFPGRALVLITPPAVGEVAARKGNPPRYRYIFSSDSAPTAVASHGWNLLDVSSQSEEAAWNLGASTTRTFLSIALPLATPGVVASAVLVFLYSLDEFTGTLLVGAPFVTTLPVYMYTASQGYELQIASVTALVLMLPGAVLLLALERFLKSEYLVFFGQL